MRKLIVAGNWKMNKTLQEGIELARAVNEKLNGQKALVVLCTPFIHLSEVKKVITKSSLYLGAQNCSSKSTGAYTGETSASMGGKKGEFGRSNFWKRISIEKGWDTSSFNS